MIDLLKKAFRTTESCNSDKKYLMKFSFKSLDELAAADREWRAALAAPEPAGVEPASGGWHMVPILPTENMMLAGMEASPLCVRRMYAHNETYTGTVTSFDTQSCADIYKAMIIAAPQPAVAEPAHPDGWDYETDAPHPEDLAKWKLSWERYEKVRKFNTLHWSKIHNRNLAGDHFDDMIDALP